MEDLEKKPEPFDDVEDNVEQMSDDEAIETMVTDIVSGLVDLSDDEVQNKLNEYDLPQEWKDDILDTLSAVRESEAGVANLPQNADFAAEVEADAQAMANEDNTPVEVTEEDKDSDGDTDKKTIEKTETKNDEEDNSSESEDKPHDSKVTSDVRLKNVDNSTNSIARTLANYRW